MPSIISLIQYRFVEPGWTDPEGRPWNAIRPGDPMPGAPDDDLKKSRRALRHAMGVPDDLLDAAVWLPADIDWFAQREEQMAAAYRQCADRGDHLVFLGDAKAFRMHDQKGMDCNCEEVARRVESCCRTATRTMLVRVWIQGGPS